MYIYIYTYYVYIYIYIYIFTQDVRSVLRRCEGRGGVRREGDAEDLGAAIIGNVQSSGRNCSPPTDLLFFKLMLPRFLSSGGVLFSQTPV